MTGVWFANTVARALGHHFALPDEVLAGIETVAAWHAATVRASERYESSLPAPTAPWPYRDGVAEHTTPSGRLHVCASDEGAHLTLYAGPATGTAGRLELVYDVEAGVYRLAEMHNLAEPPAIVGLSVEAGDRRWIVRYASRPEWPGRAIVQVYTEPAGTGWKLGVEWIAPELVFAERRYDRLNLLFRLDRAVGGAIAAADRTGHLAQAAAFYAAELESV